MTKNPHTGSNFDDFLREEGLYEECSAMTSGRSKSIAIKQMLARQLAKEMKQKKITKTEMATRMQTSRTQLDRWLDQKGQGDRWMRFNGQLLWWVVSCGLS
jgi:antitoxin HicB